ALAENPLKAEYFLPSVVEELIRREKATVKVLRSEDKWYGVTYKEDKESVMAALQSMKDKGLYPGRLWK
ncbi:MAG: nucleotidyltransferase, partial [Hornefia butyriciproducens]|nr:nucleotidyltransferase [Hornefia butyriciproducens]